MNPGPVARIMEHLKEFGLRGIHLRFLAGFSLYREMPVYELDFLTPSPAVQPGLPVEMAQLQPDEVAAYCEATAHDPASVAILHEWGAQCFVARSQGRIVARIWAAERTFPLTYLARELVLEPEELYLLDALTLPDYRGQSLLPALIGFVLQHYRQAGRQRAYTIVFSYNHASIRGFEKAGFRPKLVRGYYQFGPWRKDFERPA